ncbi:interferon alpha/beta receptor 1a-like isoform X2 [Trichomycterus rosablanca]|uniref:interferon alpha/beta receptor 1a-like isoform X2 n=1 Tax=Trichomycterus rosablanca TaxID=2290929 RepID=UPI002F35A081
MPPRLDLRLTLLVIFTVSASLPSPQNLEMTAVDRNYMLQWDWNYTHPGNFVTFTAEFTFWNDQYNEISYSRACEGLRKRQCNFTSFNLPFSGSFLIRARAKTEQQQSNWTKIRFTPDEESKLSPPSRVDVKADVGVLTLTISESVMSSVMNLQYSVLYWESSTPTQKHEKVFESTYAPLTSLKHRTEYCVQVNIFSLEHRKNSSYTSPQCVRTTGAINQPAEVVIASVMRSLSGFLPCMNNSQSDGRAEFLRLNSRLTVYKVYITLNLYGAHSAFIVISRSTFSVAGNSWCAVRYSFTSCFNLHVQQAQKMVYFIYST